MKSDTMSHTNVMVCETRCDPVDKLLCAEVQEIWATASNLDHDKNKNTMINNHKHQSCMHL